ncbi:MAG: hypothetical protein B7Y80_20935 [Hyphomicrobium sp. 32-62-53]|nr:MAG: hypothetical protein B7Z29_20215 [Hyphomicrobium sp. 12-62-95]OYX97099.1 MAG: hypothetical protein B7Y80_20935 [Hyphomicrobium sp. 32-62-53]
MRVVAGFQRSCASLDRHGSRRHETQLLEQQAAVDFDGCPVTQRTTDRVYALPAQCFAVDRQVGAIDPLLAAQQFNAVGEKSAHSEKPAQSVNVSMLFANLRQKNAIDLVHPNPFEG